MAVLKKYKWTWILLAICVVLAGYLLWDTYAAKPKLPVIRPVGEFSMQNVDGKTVTLEDTNGKVRLFYFFFANCPDVCPITTFRLSQVQDILKEKGLFGKDASIVSITFDPQRDSLENVKAFGDKFKADYSGWYFLRGDEQKTIDLAMNSFQILINKDNDGNFVHMDLIGMVDREGRLREIYRPEATPEEIAQGVIDLAKE
ncbi:MAG: SCO family protein [Paenibacillus macerans]|uniref:AhpC/TSA family protein n=1 Tax=Paenibacillus macerans TaxID=44252 RepID=A0A090ZJD5_PAEMA|nr:SCO family protein [Paenibacillus macerans]KFN10503.1 ahpC/TSA family protein [Paenibacillus macerans]MBS5909171.1 SCO family protein [Paenibacillus macerans]MCY7556845.1 SCO family protein [Paenibacillus macerans]MDU7472681.1 SCO family protein [Paenibacillus macerans]MEC0136238.1 SCO family protein [Paenibacillus macerans]